MSLQLEETRDKLGADSLLVELSRTKSSGSNISEVIKLRTVSVLPPALSGRIPIRSGVRGVFAVQLGRLGGEWTPSSGESAFLFGDR
jgi:hypothetical protein